MKINVIVGWILSMIIGMCSGFVIRSGIDNNNNLLIIIGIVIIASYILRLAVFYFGEDKK